MKNHRVILFSLVVVMNIACANAITTKDTDIRSGSGTDAKYQIAQNNKSDEEDIMHFSKGILGGITRFEKVPDDEERLIKDMVVILQEKKPRYHILNSDYFGSLPIEPLKHFSPVPEILSLKSLRSSSD